VAAATEHVFVGLAVVAVLTVVVLTSVMPARQPRFDADEAGGRSAAAGPAPAD
jgi:hypothetical protein